MKEIRIVMKAKDGTLAIGTVAMTFVEDSTSLEELICGWGVPAEEVENSLELLGATVVAAL